MSHQPIPKEIYDEVVLLAGDVQVFNASNYLEYSELPAECILLYFAGASEDISTIGDPDSLGFVQRGGVTIEWLMQTGQDPAPVLTRAETLRRSLRGRSLGGVRIERIDLFADAGSPIDQDGRWVSFASFLEYEIRECGKE
jgi:hypothetical protein